MKETNDKKKSKSSTPGTSETKSNATSIEEIRRRFYAGEYLSDDSEVPDDEDEDLNY